MPKCYEEKHKLQLPKSQGRSVGLHISEVIRDLAFRSRVLDAKWAKEVSLEFQNTNMMQIGLAWEDYLAKSKQHPEIVYHPVELKVKTDHCEICSVHRAHHGEQRHAFKRLVIYMSPDGLTWEDGAILLFLNEFKFTMKSCRDFAQGIRMGAKKTLMWIWQIAAYLKACGTLSAKLHVMFAAGNYSYDEKDPESMAVYKIFRLEYTDEEIDKIWTMLLNHALEMIRSGRYVRPQKAA